MTRLETLFREIDDAYEQQGAHGFDPIPFVRAYLAERNDAVAADLTADQATIATAAANAFDNAELDEPADDETNVFVEMFGHDPIREFDGIMARTFGKGAA